jgi:hypothetical protein
MSQLICDMSGKPLLTTQEFLFDLDTTSIGLTVTHSGKDIVTSAMDEMLQYMDADGIIQVSLPSFIDYALTHCLR